MSHRKGYTLIELVIAMLIMTIIIGGTSQMIRSLFHQYDSTAHVVDSPIRVMKTISTIENAVSGCTSIIVQPETIYLSYKTRNAKITVTDFGDIRNMVFVLKGKKLVVSIGGEQYCIPILLEQ